MSAPEIEQHKHCVGIILNRARKAFKVHVRERDSRARSFRAFITVSGYGRWSLTVIGCESI